ncbi:hypothetical protein [Geopseudomonas aromaticivorans]
MYPFALLALFMAIISGMLMHVVQTSGLIDEHRAELDKRYVSVVTEAFRLRMARTGSLGVMTLDSIQTVGDGKDEGFKARSADPVRLFIESASNLTDSVWQFDRLLIYALDKDHQNIDITSAAENKCDASAGFAVASNWCGPAAGIRYNVLETRQAYLEMMTAEVVRMQATLHKFGRGFGEVEMRRFPRATLTEGQSGEMCAYGTSYGSSSCQPVECSGVRVYQQTPFDCSDLFSIWGTPVVLDLIQNTHMAISTTSPAVRLKTGVTRQIAREIRLQ